MEKNKILEIINSVSVNRAIDQGACLRFLHHYIYERKGKHVSNEEFIALQHIFSIEKMLIAAVDYYKSKFNIVELYSKEGKLLKIF